MKELEFVEVEKSGSKGNADLSARYLNSRGIGAFVKDNGSAFSVMVPLERQEEAAKLLEKIQRPDV